MSNSTEQLVKLSQAVSFVYKTDAISPGVVISTLKNKEVYASVVRYNDLWTKGKKVVCWVKAPTLDDAIVLLSKRFVEFTSEAEPPTDPLQVLKKSIIYR